MKRQTAAERENVRCEKTQSVMLQISSEMIGVLMWFNKFSTILLKLVQ
jgi:hypothetical protein